MGTKERVEKVLEEVKEKMKEHRKDEGAPPREDKGREDSQAA